MSTIQLRSNSTAVPSCKGWTGRIKKINVARLNIWHKRSDRVTTGLQHCVCGKETTEWRIGFPSRWSRKRFWILSTLKRTEQLQPRYGSNTPWRYYSKYHNRWTLKRGITYSFFALSPKNRERPYYACYLKPFKCFRRFLPSVGLTGSSTCSNQSFGSPKEAHNRVLWISPYMHHHFLCTTIELCNDMRLFI